MRSRDALRAHFVAIAVLAIVLSAAIAHAEDVWEFAVCAAPHNYPASSRERSGYENEIAHIVADELGAEVRFVWADLDDVALERLLHRGECDAVVGVPDGIAGVESTIPFLRTPYVFVTMRGRGPTVEHLDDPRLAELAIGTYPGGIPSIALSNRGLQANLVEFAPLATPSGLDREGAILDALVDGQIDVAVVFAPAAAARAAEMDESLVIHPVSPELDMGARLLQMFRTSTIGVRPHDVDLRERLDHALAARWDEVQGAIARYGVPRLSVIRPSLTGSDRSDAPGIGLILPMESAAEHPFQSAGRAAHSGATFAEATIALAGGRGGGEVRVLLASAPSDEAAERAARRLAARPGVIALIGGFGRAQARALSHVAVESGIVFLNVAAPDEEFRSACHPLVFHVTPSVSMYIDALTRWYGKDAVRGWYVVSSESRGGAALPSVLEAALPRGGNLLGSVEVPRDNLIFTHALAEIADAEPDVVVTYLEPQSELMFHAQGAGGAEGRAVTGVPGVLTNLRPHLYALGQADPQIGLWPRPTGWDPSIPTEEALELNDAFLARTGDPMEPAAWDTYAAVLMAHEAAARGSKTGGEFASFLAGPDAVFDDGFGVAESMWIDPSTHQLVRPIHMVRIDPDAPWSRRGSVRAAITEHVETLRDVAVGSEAAGCV